MPSRAFPVEHPEVGVELVRVWEPESEPRATVVLVHGLAEHSGRYERTGSLFAEAGYLVRGFDLIGAGASGGPRWDVEHWHHYHEQVRRHIEWAREQELPVVLFGHSLGGNVALGYTLSDRSTPDLLVLSAPALAGGAGWLRTAARIGARLMPSVSLANAVKGEHLSRDPQVAEDYFADPLVNTKSSFRLGDNFFEEMARLNDECSSLDVPTLVIHGGDDVLVPTDSSEVLESSTEVERRVYDGLRHEILNEPEGPEVVADVIEWIEAQLSSS